MKRELTVQLGTFKSCFGGQNDLLTLPPPPSNKKCKAPPRFSWQGLPELKPSDVPTYY